MESKTTTEAPSPYLTQKQVDDLPEGTEVMILWSGGNGPHKHIIGKYSGKSYTTFIGSDNNRHIGELINFVGDKIYQFTNGLAFKITPPTAKS